MFITNGVHADLYFIAAKSGPGKREMSMFIVEKGTPGFSVGRALKKTGWLSSDTAELVLDNVRIPAANLLGEEGKGFYSVMKNFQTERIALAAMAVGHCQQALQADAGLRAPAPGVRRAAVGPADDPPAAVDAGCQDARRAAVHVPLRLARHAGPRHRAGRVDAQGADRRTGQRGGATCQQFHGGMGYIREMAIERLWRDARVLAIGGGATEVMLEEVAKRY
jgi:acyl-CoA dehydrogenase